ncbi:MAG TPA: carbon-phosphorus lyase complex subunit PhnJ [Clostridiales bacterium]|jgi:alpha-D-ribose 1-methylphosphonate 5-phosphate C-P lyase|nr:carbon-phosphorus lyase complex subunit PhnJ [Clostridiales bacterium]
MINNYNFGFLDEGSKREIRRSTLKAVAIPGYQVPFASREMPIARGWGTGGLQLTLSLINKNDVFKAIDQGTDESVNAVNIKNLVNTTTGVANTTDTNAATIIQSRHRIPEEPMEKGQVLVLQVPMPEPLRFVEPKEEKTKKLHANKDYSGAWLVLFEKIIKFGRMTGGAAHPVMVNDRYIMSPSPIPKYDNAKLNNSQALILLGAGREKKIYALPPYTKVESLAFEDYPFEVEDTSKKKCRLCGVKGVFFDEIENEKTGEICYQCNDTSSCLKRLNKKESA